MADLESCSRIEQRSVIEFLVAEQGKTSEIFRRMFDVYKEACFNQKNVYKWAKLFKEERKKFFVEDWPGKPTGVRTPTMIKLMDDTMQSDRIP